MAEIFEGKIINDKDVSLPTMDDFYHNSLVPIAERGKVNSQNFKYVEMPPDGENAVGTVADGTIFTIKPKKLTGWELEDQRSIGEHFFECSFEDAYYVNEFDAGNLTLDTTNCDVGSNAEDVQYFKDLINKHTSDIKGYFGSLTYSNLGQIREEGIFKARLLCVNPGNIPKITKEYIGQNSFIKKRYEDVKKEYGLIYSPLKTIYENDLENDNLIRFDIKSSDLISHIESNNHNIQRNNNDELLFCGKYQILQQPVDGWVYVIKDAVVDIDETVHALKLKDELSIAIAKATDARICISKKILEPSSNKYWNLYPEKYKEPDGIFEILYDEFADYANDRFDNQNWHKYTGWNLYGEDKYGRELCVVYIKADLDGKGEQWINLNKYLICKDIELRNGQMTGYYNEMCEEENNILTECFKPWTYKLDQINYIDNWFETVVKQGQDDRRKEIQKQCFNQAGYHLCGNDLYDWTVSIGDVTFFIPPTAIKLVSETSTERLPVLRAKGSMAKNIEKSDNQLELTIFFNRDIGINGLPIELDLWKKYVEGKDGASGGMESSPQKQTYYMNGLRALYSEFRFTPMLPIVNKYINDTLNIYAVSMERIDISTVVNFPRLIQVRLILKKFDYGVYMPEIPDPYYKVLEDGTETDELVNPYSQSINYDVLRWYYQRPILKGNELHQKLMDPNNEYTVNSLEFMHDTLGSNRSSFMPCDFLNPNIDIYVANEDHLDNLLNIKKEAKKKAKTAISDSIQVPNDNRTSEFVSDIIQLDNSAHISTGWKLSDIIYKYHKRINNILTSINAWENSGNFVIELPSDIPLGVQVNDSVNQISIDGASVSQIYDTLNDLRDKYIVESLYEDLQNNRGFGYITNSAGEKLVLKVKKYNHVIALELNTPSILNHQDLNDLIAIALAGSSTNREDSAYNYNEVYKNNELRFNFGNWDDLEIHQAGNDYINYAKDMIQKDNIDLEFYLYCVEKYQSDVDANQEAEELKESMDWDDEHTLKFDLVGKDIRVDLFEASAANNFSRISLLDSDGFAPQYLGSQDIHISWRITTKDTDFVSLMRGLPEFEAYCMRKYHLVLPSFPIRIDSEFTRMLGVYEVSIESVNISTVPNYPNLYIIDVRAISTDRTLRNRESLRSLANKDQEITNNNSGELDNTQVTTSDMATEVNIRSKEELSQKLAAAELYPDLELPTIGELGKLGFRFIRYRDKERDAEDLYVDPDFYFYYPYTIKAEVIKATLNALYGNKISQEEIEEAQRKLMVSDLSGAKAELKPIIDFDIKITDGSKDDSILDTILDPTPGIDFSVTFNNPACFDLENANEQAKKNVQEKIDAVEQNKEAKRQEREMNLAKKLPAAIMGDAGRWNISSTISVAFMEKFYLGLKEEMNKTVSDKNKETDEEEHKLTEEQKKELREFYEDKLKGSNEATKELLDNLKNSQLDLEETNELLIKRKLGADKNLEYIEDGVNSVIDEYEEILNRMAVFTHASVLEEVASNTGEFISNNWQVLLNPLAGVATVGAMAYNLYNSENRNLKEMIVNFAKATASALTGDYEYNSSLGDGQWMGCSGYYFGIYKDGNNIETAINPDEVIPDNIVSAGIFGIKKYTAAELLEFLSGDESTEFKDFSDKLQKENPTKTYYYVLDPYYRFHPELTNDFLKACCINTETCAQAYTRIVLWWLAKLYKDDIFPTIGLDVMRKSAINASEAKDRASELVKKQYGTNVADVDNDLINQIKAYAESNGGNLDAGKFFTAFVLALYGKPDIKSDIYKYIKERNYGALNDKTRGITSQTYKYRKDVNNADALFRRFLFALVGYGVINGVDYIGKRSDVSPASKYITNHNTKIALQAAEDPNQYMLHSYYDMVRGDYRGRMLRAFPTFYCIFIDEGREIGVWKLFDNFYSMNSIYSIDITKSRKIAADTCSLVLSNNYSTFITDDEDGYINYKGVTWGELWDSLMENRNALDRLLKKRLAADRVNKAKLQPGIRIHIREGYGSDAREIPCVFNGVISQVQPGGQAISIIAQGNGIELMNPIMEERDADEIQFKDLPGDGLNETSGGGASPRKIISSFLTTKGDAITRYVYGKYDKDQFFFNNDELGTDEDFTDGLTHYLRKIWDDNPYGIHSFGDPNFQDIFPEGEVVQNLYEVSSYPNLDQDGMDLYAYEKENNPPYISFESRGKTMWDIIHICQSVAPDYITGVTDFGFRSTIFFGKPHYYYAYDYKYDNELDTFIEKRKPYQQYHIYFSDSDIIANNIQATNKYINTVATGLYQDRNVLINNNRDVGPLFVDKDIYPENQKSMVVDTRLQMKDAGWWRSNQKDTDTVNDGESNAISFFTDGLGNMLGNIVQDIGTGTAGLFSMLNNLLLEHTGIGIGENEYVEHKKIAWAATANALKESIKEMYQGSLIVMGDPSVKPLDRICISDQYNDMTGHVLVRDVVHSINATTGFTTTINVDCISVVDDRDEFYKQNGINQLISNVAQHTLLTWPLKKFLYNRGARVLSEWGTTIASGAEKISGTFVKNGESIFTKLKNMGTTIAQGINTPVMKGIKMIIKKAGPWAIVAAGVEALSYNFNQTLYWTIKNSQVLTIYPLKKNGMVLTSGLEGNIGSVYGSPTYKDLGPLEKIYNQYLTPNPENSAIFSVFQSLLLEEDVMNEAAKLNRNFKYYSGLGENALENEEGIQSTTMGIMKRNEFHYRSTLYGKSLLNRANLKIQTPDKIKVIKNALSRYHVDNIEKIINNSNKKNIMMISRSTDLKPYLEGDSKFLEIAHDSLDSSTNISYRTYYMTLDGKQVPFNAILEKLTYNDGKEYQIADVPFLCKDAIDVIKFICLNVKENLQTTNQADAVQAHSAQNGTKIVITSALRIGSPSYISSSAHAFSLRGTGALADKLKTIVQDIHDGVAKGLEKYNKIPMFNIENSNSNSEVKITINPVTPLGE